MTIIPGQRPVERFTVDFRGSFGRFRTECSHTLHYLQTTLRTNDLNRLATASETFDIRQIDFEELIQRDIDQERVARIANDYLSAGKDRAIFFPPLLVCLAVLDDQGTLKASYDVVESSRVQEAEASVLRTIFDRDGFRLDLYATDARYSDRTIEWAGADAPVPFFDYAAKLSINPDRTKLVVLDGQHRLQALKQLLKNPDTRAIVANIEQPVCIVWMPHAAQGNEEHIVHDLRDVFVTVNSEPQRVSGHFILLLRDNSYAAATVRALADIWKANDANGWSRLHLLEWNTRDDRNTDQRQRQFSITTVSIVADVLEPYLFNVPGLAPALLKLDERAAELEEADPDFDFRSMRDHARGLVVNQIINHQIEQHLVPALDHLLRKVRPYAALEELLNSTFVAQKQQIDRGTNPAASSLRSYLSRFIYSGREMYDEFAQGAWEVFKATVVPAPEDRVYFLAVFQQGYLRFWLALARLLADHGVSAHDSAKAAVAAAQAYVAKPLSGYLQEDQAYARRVLWRNGTVNYDPRWAKEAWTDIQLATLLRSDVMKALVETLPVGAISAEQLNTFKQRVFDMALSATRRYASTLKDQIAKEVNRNLADFFGEVQAGVLRDLRTTKPDQFDQSVGQVVRERFDEALDGLAASLQQTTDQLQPTE